MRRYHTVVVGLGGMGSAAAADLASRGVDVFGVERFAPAHDRGSSHGDSRIVRMAYFEHPDYVPLIRRAYDGWAALGERVGRELINWTGALMIGTPEAAVVSGTVASARQWSLACEELSGAAMEERFPQYTLADTEVAIHESNAGFVDPEAAVLAAIDVARNAGAELAFGTLLEGWDLTGRGVEVAIGGERIHADHLVLTAGPWTTKVLGAQFPLEVVRTVVHYFTPDDDDAFTPDRFPVFVWEMAQHSGDAIYGLPSPSRGAVKVGFFNRNTPADPDAIEREVGEEEVTAMRDALRSRLPAVATGEYVASSVCMFTMTPDQHFVIGHVPGADSRVSVACGFSGHGFKFAPVVGEILADLAIDGGTDLPVALFDPTRFVTRTADW